MPAIRKSRRKHSSIDNIHSSISTSTTNNNSNTENTSNKSIASNEVLTDLHKYNTKKSIDNTNTKNNILIHIEHCKS